MNEIKKENVLIANRVKGKGDTWKLINNDIEYNSLTDTLEAYFQLENRINYQNKYVDFYLSPINGKLYVVDETIVEVQKKTFNIYGEQI